MRKYQKKLGCAEQHLLFLWNLLWSSDCVFSSNQATYNNKNEENENKNSHCMQFSVIIFLRRVEAGQQICWLIQCKHECGRIEMYTNRNYVH